MGYAVGSVPFSAGLQAALFGLTVGREAYNVTILGSRSLGWEGTTMLGDACDYLNTTQSLMNTPTSGQTLYIVSTNANDDDGQSGARTVRIVYLDANGDQQTTTATMNGTAAVSLGSGFTFIQWMEVASTGADEVAAGNIAVTSTNGAATVDTTFDMIAAGGNRSLSGRYKVPAGYTAYVTHWSAAAVGSASMDARLRATTFADDESLSTEYHFKDRVFLSSGSNAEMLLPYVKLLAGAIIKVSAKPSNASAGNKCDCDFHMILIKD